MNDCFRAFDAAIPDGLLICRSPFLGNRKAGQIDDGIGVFQDVIRQRLMRQIALYEKEFLMGKAGSVSGHNHHGVSLSQ